MHERVFPLRGKSNRQITRNYHISLFQAADSEAGTDPETYSKHPIICAKGTLFHALRKASLTAEAALAAPLFLICVIVLVSMLDIYGLYVRRLLQLQAEAEQYGAALQTPGIQGDVIDLASPVEWDVPGFGLFGGHVSAACRARVRPWTGRDRSRNGDDENEGEKLVYVTEHGQVYHTNAACTHIDLSLHAEESGALDTLRNSHGSCYHACEKCVGSGQVNSIVYITDDGERYHNSAACSGLKRSVHLVPASEAGNLPLCSRCGSLDRDPH